MYIESWYVFSAVCPNSARPGAIGARGFARPPFCFLAVNPAFMGVSKPFRVQYGKHIGAMVTAIIPSSWPKWLFKFTLQPEYYWVSTLSPQVDISESSSHTLYIDGLRKAGAAGEFFSSWGASPWPRKMSPSRLAAPKKPGPVVWELGGSLNLRLIFHKPSWNQKAVEWDSGNVMTLGAGSRYRRP